MLIGVTGSTGSGKTTFAKKLADEIGREQCLLIHQDSYYIDRSHLSREEAERSNYDHPDSIEFPLLESHLGSLKKGIPVRIPHYDYAAHRRSQGETETPPKEIIILEGILIFHSAKIRELLDLKIFLHVDEDVMISRRIERDIRERGRTREEVLSQYYNTVKPMNDKFVIPSMKWTDLVIPTNIENQIAIKVIADYVKTEFF